MKIYPIYADTYKKELNETDFNLIAANALVHIAITQEEADRLKLIKLQEYFDTVSITGLNKQIRSGENCLFYINVNTLALYKCASVVKEAEMTVN